MYDCLTPLPRTTPLKRLRLRHHRENRLSDHFVPEHQIYIKSEMDVYVVNEYNKESPDSQYREQSLRRSRAEQMSFAYTDRDKLATNEQRNLDRSIDRPSTLQVRAVLRPARESAK